MNKEELISAISEKSKLTKVDSKKFLDAYVEVVAKALQAEDTVQLVGFGSFSVSKRPERKGCNPRTGAEITIAASKIAKFTSGKQLKEEINK
jgi:DNA-binding protein HU-beta